MANLEIRLLGSLYVTLGGRTVTDFEYDKVRALLVYLSVISDRPHRREALAGFLWPEQPERNALNSLRQALATLRKTIKDRETDPPYLLINRDAVRFNPNSDYWLDVDHFTGLLRRCKGHPHRRVGVCTPCVQRLEQAVQAYQGDFLEKFYLKGSAAFEEWALIRREELRRLVLDTLHCLAAYYERQGEYAGAHHYAIKQLALDPYQEEAHRQLMRALAFSGQRIPALQKHAAYRQLLNQDLGAEPEEKTNRLVQIIKSGQLKSTSSQYTVYHANLPAPLTPFVGREEEIIRIVERLENPDYRLVTITGLGGTGKTRLAIQAAARAAGCYADGACFVPLSAVGSAEFIASSIAEALDFSFSAGIEPQKQLLNYLRTKDLLLVLDNFEHLLPDGASFVVEILQTAPEVTLLITSRERLNTLGEWIFELEGLDYPEDETAIAPLESYSAAELFLLHARRQVGSDLGLQQSLGDVARLCRLVEGMPLAIELSAAMMPVLSCAEIVRQLEQGGIQLNASLIGLSERHRNLQVLFEQSWLSISIQEQHVFSEISIFRGGFTRLAAEKVARATPALLARLTKKSLFRFDHLERYDMHELLRQYAYEKLCASGKVSDVKARHLSFFTDLAEEAEAHLTGEKQSVWLERLDAEIDNLRAALDCSRAKGENCLRLAGALWRFWFVRGHLHEGRQWLDQVLAANASSSSPVKVKALNGAGVLAYMQQEYRQAMHYHEESLAIAREHADQSGIAYSLHYLGVVLIASGDYQEAETCSQESLYLFQEVDDRRGIAIAIRDLADIARERGDLSLAEKYFREALSLRQALGDQHGVGRLFNDLGVVVYQQGNLGQAAELFEMGLSLLGELHDNLGIANSKYNLGKIALESGESARANTLFQESLAMFNELGDKKGMLLSLEGLSAVS